MMFVNITEGYLAFVRCFESCDYCLSLPSENDNKFQCKSCTKNFVKSYNQETNCYYRNDISEEDKKMFFLPKIIDDNNNNNSFLSANVTKYNSCNDVPEIDKKKIQICNI